MTTTTALTWAFEATGLDPASKLVLILAANSADQDGHLFAPYDRLAARANLTLEGIDNAVETLRKAGLAGYGLAEHPETGDRAGCIILTMEG